MTEAALLIAGYFIGAIPFGYLIAKAHGVDIFQVGSGNVGATNIKRALGLKWALVVFVLDVLKGAAPALAARFLLDSQTWAMIVGAAAILGHCLSPFLRFRGGKGISTTLGVALAGAPIVALCAFGVWIICMAITSYVSLSSMIAVPSALLFTWIFRESTALYAFYGVLTLFVLATHRANINRLRKGTEPKFHFKGDKSKQEETAAPDNQDEGDMNRQSKRSYSRGDQHA